MRDKALSKVCMYSREFFLFLFGISLLQVSLSCGGGGQGQTSQPPTSSAPWVQISLPNQVLSVGEVVPLQVSVSSNASAAPQLDLAVSGGSILVSGTNFSYQAPATPGHYSLRYRLANSGDPFQEIQIGVWDVRFGAIASLPASDYWSGHGVVALGGGEFLLAGNSNWAFSAEIFDITTKTPTWTGDMVGRYSNLSSLQCANKQIIYLGGYGTNNNQADSDYIIQAFDPTSRKFFKIGETYYPHYTGANLKELGDGRLLIIGGTSGSGFAEPMIELFDPKIGGVARVIGWMQEGRSWPVCQEIANNRLWIMGGDHTQTGGLKTDILDLTTFSRTDGPKIHVDPRGATPLGGGRYLLISDSVSGGSEIFNTGTMQSEALIPLDTPRELANGTIIVPFGAPVSLASGAIIQLVAKVPTIPTDGPWIELFDPLLNKWRVMGKLQRQHYVQPVLGTDGRLFLIGGLSLSTDAPIPEVDVISVN